MGIAIPQVITPSKASGAQVIDGSLKFDNTKSNYLSRTPGSSGNLRTWTWSSWIKRTKFGATGRILRINPSGESGIQFASDDKLELYHYADSSYTFQLKTTQVLRDTGWYHIVIAFDTTQSTSTDRVKFYINGTQVTSFSTSSYPSENFESYFNLNSAHSIFGSDLFPAGYVSQINWIDGQALGPESFGFTDPLTNTWKPKKFVPTKINDGTTWSSNVTGNIYGGSAANVFDGEASADRAEINSSDANDNHFTLSSMSVTASKVGVFVSNSSSNVEVSVNGSVVGTISSGDIDSSSKLFSFTFTETTVTSIKVRRVGSTSGWYLYGINLNDVPLLDGDTTNFGLNGFYLPFDGNSPIGQDKSGNGNDFTPVNFGGSVALDNPIVSGARPTLNTTQGGTQAGVGVFGSSENKVITVTVASKTGGGNAYFFDGVERDSLALIRGTTIRFDTTDSSNDSHPFKLSSTNADSSGGTEYTDGAAYFVNGGQKNGTDYVNQYSSHSSGFRGIKWTVPHNVSTTYYYCTVHTGMGEDGRLTSTTDETKADKFAWKCFFALPCVGPNIDLSSVINLKSGGKSLTVSGASSSSVETLFYNKSIYFDGSNDNIKTESTSHFLSPAEYTIEGWINITSAPASNNGEAVFDTGSGGSDPELNTFNNSGTLQMYESLSNNTNWDGDTLQTG